MLKHLRSVYRYSVFLAVFAAAVLICRPVDAASVVDYTKVTDAGSYGSIVMKKSIGNRKGLRPVVFPHWVHREKYTCKVCHTELGYALKAGTAVIKQADIEAGESCGVCHNGKIAFDADKCARCHSYGVEVKENARIEDALKGLPPDDFGNKVDWVEALDKGKIKPKAVLEGKGKMTVVDMDIVIPVTKFQTRPPDVLYSHKVHTQQLDCTSCHVDIFQMQKGGNPEMNMMKIISGQYCGVCHGRVAFPLINCFRCHSQPLPDSVHRWWDEEREVKEEKKVVEEKKGKKKKKKKRRKK